MDIFETSEGVFRWSVRGFNTAMDAEGLSNVDIAKIARVSEQAVSYWRQGIAKPREDKMLRVLKALGAHAHLAAERLGR